jgi:hypothetical protein
MLVLCDGCRWWNVLDLSASRGFGWKEASFIEGVARAFRVDALDPPIADLRRYLAVHPNDAAHVNPTAFERLIGDCLASEYEPCEVEHVGRSGDGGIDLKLITSSKETYLVQVKRRTDLDSTEGVDVVRSLNGVLFREGATKGIVVSSAKKFSEAAWLETSDIKTILPERYAMDLLAFADIQRLLPKTGTTVVEPWASQFSKVTHLPPSPDEPDTEEASLNWAVDRSQNAEASGRTVWRRTDKVETPA